MIQLQSDLEYIMNDRLKVSLDAIAKFCQRWKIIEFALFGSVLRDDFRPDSDVEVLVTYEPSHSLTLSHLLDLSQKERVDRSLLKYNEILPPLNMSKLREYLEKHPSETQRMLGIDYDQLIQLITNAENLYDRQKESQESQKTRLIKRGSGRPPKLTIADQILLTLVYLHNLPTFQMLGVQFDIGESTANYIFHRWVKILRELLPASVLEQVKKNDADRTWVLEILQEVLSLLTSQKFQGDKAYVGEPLINTPHKKPRQGVLTAAQKRANKSKAQKRIFVEHLIRLLKIWRVASERFRLKSQKYERIILVVCGLVRWRIGAIVMCQ
jgi:predicted nucleotidyltransferase